MKYEHFDKLLGRKTEENVINLLKAKALKADELADLTGMHRTTIFYHLKKLEKKEIVKAKIFSNNIYYGLTQKYRQQQI